MVVAGVESPNGFVQTGQKQERLTEEPSLGLQVLGELFEGI